MGEVSSEKGKMQGFKLTFFILILGIFGEGAEKMNIKKYGFGQDKESGRAIRTWV